MIRRWSSFWQSVRPRSRFGVLRAALLIGGLGVALTLIVFIGLGVGGRLFADYGFHPEGVNDRVRSLQPVFGTVSRCAECHATQYQHLNLASHAGIGCESCHGPLGKHAANPETAFNPIVPTDVLCVRCHADALGRPAGQREVVLSDHYLSSSCLACHNPHTGVSQRPPEVSHPLERLPHCIVCHGENGFKARNQRHPVATEDDQSCMACHLPGRGPAVTAPPEGG